VALTALFHADSDRIYRVVMWRLMPVLMLAYILNYIDRSNIGLAKLQFLRDLGMSEAAYGLAAGAFYLGYVSLGIPVNIVLGRIGARKSLLIIMMAWGGLSAALAFVTAPSQFYVLRFLIGVAETGFLPAALLYLSRWVPQRYRARFNGIFLAAIAVAGFVGGPIGGYIMQSTNGALGLRGWQQLFLLEGLLTCVISILVFATLKEQPRDASWLSEAQKRQIDVDLAAGQDAGINASRQPLHASLWTAFRDRRFLALMAIAVSGSVGTSAIGLWLPSVIRETGITDILVIGLLSAIPNGFAIFVQYFNARHSDRSGERRWHAAGPLLVAALGWLCMPWISHSPWLSILAMTIIASATFSFTGPFWSMPTAILSGSAAAGGLGAITSALGLGSFISPVLMGRLIDSTHTLAAGEIYLALVLSLGSLALLLGLRAGSRAAEG
jgi:MFS family permease